MRGYWGILQAAAWTWIVTLLSAQRDCEQDWVGAGCSHRPGPVVCVLALPTVFLIKARPFPGVFFFVCLFVCLFCFFPAEAGNLDFITNKNQKFLKFSV
jgi:hypothetical protein